MKSSREDTWTGFLPKKTIVMKKKKTAGSARTKKSEVRPAASVCSGSLDDLRVQLKDCSRCKLSKTRTNIVFGEGNPQAKLMFVGEGPGANEDLQGRPFVGRAGDLLTKMIEAMGLKREDVFIANVVKCRPPENRNPEPDEIEQCSPFLFHQIEQIKPQVVVALGKFAAQTLLQTETPITQLRGEFQPFHGSLLMPTYHPAYLLRNPPAKKEVWEDLKKVCAKLGLSVK